MQALQSKHDALLQRVDDLDNECEDLRDRLMEAEGERDDLQDALDNKEQLHTELHSKLEENKVTVSFHRRSNITEEKPISLFNLGHF